MKLTTGIILFTCLSVSASSFSQRITLEGKGISIENVFKAIEKQSGYVFFYDYSILSKAKPVTVQVKNVPLRDALIKCFEGQPFIYNIVGKTIAVKPEKGISTKKVPPKIAAPENLLPAGIDIAGTVTDEENNTPLYGASVTVKNLNRTVITDKNGGFVLKNIDNDAVLVISYVGYERKEVNIGGQTNLQVKLKRSESQMQDLVVIGYGSVAKRDVTGSVGQINVAQMQKAPVATFDQALAGRVAGVQVSSNDGQPGVPNQIVIRGNNSLTQSNEPLYVIDGYPVESFEDLPISPSDIESMQVLKDASATSIYGSRGANGVVIITTKSGLKGKPVISVNSYYGVQEVTKFMNMMSPYEFVKYENELNPTITQNLYLQNKTLDDYKSIKGYNMQKELYQAAPFFNADIGFRGGNDGTQYSVSTNILRSEGVIINSGYNRVQGKFTLAQQLNKNIKAYVNTSYTRTKTSGALVSDATGGTASLSKIYSTLGYRPVSGSNDSLNLLEELFDPAVLDLTTSDYRVNPIISSKNEINDRILSTSVINGYIDFKLSKSLLLKIRGGVTNSSLNRVAFYNSKTQRGNPNYPTSRGTTGSVLEVKSEDWLNENTLTYNKKIGKHKLNVLTGFTLQERNVFVSGYTAEYIADESLGIDGIDMATSLIPSTYHKGWSLASFLSRVNYDYKEKYLLTASFRADGSSKFKGQNKWGYFPSAALAWRVNKEPFLKSVDQFSDLKLRISYGVTGNNRVDEYATYSGVYFPVEAFYSFNNSSPMRGASLNPNAGTGDLRWESTAQFNAGLDLGLLNDRINFVVDYYNKRTNDLLLNADLPYSTGYLSAFQNIGSIQNRGLEFTLQTQNIKNNNFSWNSSFNISFNKNKVLKLQDGQSYRLSTVSFGGGFSNVAPYIAKVGEPMGLIYGAVFDRLYQYEDFNQLSNGSYELKEDVPGNGVARNTIQPGDMKFIDQNADGTINSDDYTVIGNGNPLHTGGFINDLRFQNFDLSIFLQWSYGNDIINANRLYFEQNVLNLYNLNLYSSVTNRWSEDNQHTAIPRANSKTPIIYHSNIIEDGSYLRLKTVSLGYNFPDSRLTNRLGIKTFRAYCSVQNIFTLTGYSGSDPEVSVRHSALTPGFDWSAYPRARTITVGLNVSF
ncbi:MAG: TonB-dependent receptor [Niabella sp.]